jgi:tetratricopeptide (TPR) repeat protein
MARTTVITVRKGIALGAVPFLVLLIAACARGPSWDETFMPRTEAGLTPQTMSGILLTQEKFQKSPEDKKLPYVLAYQYLQALRENADTDFYGRIENVLKMLERQGIHSPEHDFLRGLILMGKHRFAEALPVGMRLITENPFVHRYYGLAVDAQVELGQYEKAVATLQRMADQNPDAGVMARIAYVREIHGDMDGAKQAMEQVIAESVGGGENRAWDLAELARLWLPSDPAKADTLYAQALTFYPRFAPALAGRARAAMELGHADTAAAFAQQATEVLALPEYPALLGDIKEARGDHAGAQAQYALVSIGYDAIAKSGTDVSLERSRFLADHHLELDQALTDARATYAARPTIFAADVLAWTLYQGKQYAEAETYAAKALATGTHDPMILFHAGLIAKANGKTADAKHSLQTVRTESPHFSFVHEKQLADALQELAKR